MIGTIDITVNAQHPNVPLSPVFTWRGSASRINVEGVPCLCGSWYVASVSIAIATPDGKTVTYPCQRSSNGIYSATVEATDTPGKSANGITITATDEDGKDFVLGRGDLYILDGAAIPAPGDVSWSVRLLDKKPDAPKEGDAYFAEDGTLMVFSGGEWRNTMPSAIVPTKVSAFENDAGYITEKQVKPGSKAGYAADAERADKANSVAWSGVTDRPTKVSEFDNDAGYLTEPNGAVLLVEDVNGEKTAATIGSRKSDGAVGASSLANGRSVTASGNFSHAEGFQTTAEGEFTHAEGFNTKASWRSHAEGTQTTASGQYSHAEGSGTKAEGVGSHAEGVSTKASGLYSHAEGYGTTASGDYSHAEGYGTTASGNGSHAEGYSTTASGNFSHAEGIKSGTLPADSCAYSWNGDGTRAEPYSSHGKGTFNVNPVGGSDGLYIGEQKLSAVISEATADKLTAADVVPKGSGTETIATIAGKDIKAPAGGGGGIGYMFVKPVDAGGDSTRKLMLGDVYLYGYGYYGNGGTSLTLIPIHRTVDNVLISTLYCTPGETLVLPCAADDPRNGTAFDFPVGSCLEVSTAIAMADGTTKRVADVRVGDKVLAIDPLTGEKTVDTVTETAHGWKDRRDIWTFGDGTTVTTVGRHRFYDVDLGEFLYLDAWEPGEGARAADGCKVRLVGHERVEGWTEYATIWTEIYNNYFAGGLLAGNRRSITGGGL